MEDELRRSILAAGWAGCLSWASQEPEAVAQFRAETARQALTEARSGATTPFVIEYAGGPIARIDHGFRRAVRKAGIAPYSPHDIRRTAARRMAEAGVSMAVIASYLGHSSVAETERVYARYLPTYLRGAAAALEV